MIENSPIYLITDRTLSGLTHSQIVRQAIAAGIRTIQLREKQMSKKNLYREALSIRSLTLRHKTTFIMNDYIDIALAAAADGVHLGQDDMPIKEARKIMGKKKIIGISTHSLKQAISAEDAGADYIGFGPMFSTSTKDSGLPKGLKALREVRKHIKIPIVAIGGINPENVSSALEAGADSVAVMSAILRRDIKRNTEKFLSAITMRKQSHCDFHFRDPS
ncbi:MAG: thiamine phosphate synthase [Nitrospirae bacterium]|nr:thiamine phosphate synthase [Nitrospirota bacterium]